ncbi:hypothetical protein [Dietzia sp. CH92]|uniref:hypothetical protein n=1 Tax=Dietzia sp. CH92 TaxID=3051823 RepID=UPI0028D75B1A|nr:hypothetical protein [Dietzia sp. CH92]
MGDITGSIANTTIPLSIETFGSFDGIGSSAVDTILGFVLNLPNTLLTLVAGIGADLGSTLGNPQV